MKILLFFLLLLFIPSGVFSQESPKEDFLEKYLQKRNDVGIRKLIAWTFMLSEVKTSNHRINNFSIEYARRLGRRWRVGVFFYDFTENLTKGLFYVHPPYDYNSDSGVVDANIGVSGNMYGFTGSFDIVQKQYLIVRVNASLSIFCHVRSFYLSLQGTFGDSQSDSFFYHYWKKTNELVSRYSNAFSEEVDLHVSNVVRVIELPVVSLGVDFLYPLMGHELGISTHIAPGNNPKIRLSGTFNFRF